MTSSCVHSFTVSLHSPTDGQIPCRWSFPGRMLVALKKWWIFPSATWVHNALPHEAIPTYIYTSQSQKDGVSQLEVVSHTHCHSGLHQVRTVYQSSFAAHLACPCDPRAVSNTIASSWMQEVLKFPPLGKFMSFNVQSRLCEMQKVPLKFQTKDRTHTLKYEYFMHVKAQDLSDLRAPNRFRNELLQPWPWFDCDKWLCWNAQKHKRHITHVTWNIKSWKWQVNVSFASKHMPKANLYPQGELPCV